MTWTIATRPEEVAVVVGHVRLRYVLRRDSEERDVFVEAAGTAWPSEPTSLLSPIDEVVFSRGRSQVERHLER